MDDESQAALASFFDKLIAAEGEAFAKEFVDEFVRKLAAFTADLKPD